MNIKWTIEKKRGNFRAVLNYEICLEDFEKELAVPTVTIVSRIAQIPEPRNRFCLPDTNERVRGWLPARFHPMSTPGFRRGETQKSILLPYVSSSQFSEVEASFCLLRSEFEKEMQAAKESESVLIRNELRLTEKTSKKMAGDIVAHKMLKLVGV